MRHSPPGFSLIEAAIVLGIVGLVIGGIWVAASKVAFNNRVNGFTEDIGMIVQKIQENQWRRKNTAISGNTSSQTIYNTKILPTKWTCCQVDAGNSYVVDPYFSLWMDLEYNSTASLVSFEAIDGLTDYLKPEECVAIIRALIQTFKSNKNSNDNVTILQDSTPPVYYLNAPPSVSTLSTDCTSDSYGFSLYLYGI